MASFLERLIGRNRSSSAEIAKERLKLVLVTDRSNLPQERLEAMQAEIIEVIKRYVEVDEMEVQLKVEQRDRHNYLVADIPLQRDKSYQMASEMAPPPPPDPSPPQVVIRPRKSRSTHNIVEPELDPDATVPHVPPTLDDDDYD